MRSSTEDKDLNTSSKLVSEIWVAQGYETSFKVPMRSDVKSYLQVHKCSFQSSAMFHALKRNDLHWLLRKLQNFAEFTLYALCAGYRTSRWFSPLYVSRVLSFNVLGALFVRFGFLVLMRFHVFGQVVAPHEPLAAVGTGEALLPGVCPQVPLQLVGACETFPAEEPVAHKRPLSGVPAKVCF